jgi:lysophospholipase L1-like esterase
VLGEVSGPGEISGLGEITGSVRRRWIVLGGITLAGALVVLVVLALVSVSAPRNQAKVAFYGDSYTLGTGASDPSKRWSTIISTERNWDEFNPSVNGLGFFTHRTKALDLPSMVIAVHPDIVFITMGLNDNFSYPESGDAIRANITSDFARLSKALPKARFIVVEPFWYTDERPDSLAVINGWVKDAATSIHADYISGASHWLEGHPEWMANDGEHPNDDGYAEMARRMDMALTKLGL